MKKVLAVIAVALALASACSSDDPSATPGPTGTAASGSPAASARAEGACQGAQLRMQDEPLTAPEGHVAIGLTITNSGAPCFIEAGFPSIQFFDRLTQRMQFEVAHDGNEFVSGATPQRLDIATNGPVYVALDKPKCDAPTDRAAFTIGFTLPSGTFITPLRLKDTGGAFDFCEPGDPGLTVQVSAMAKTAEETLNPDRPRSG